ncbi:MAG TPA: polysaccharide biosynthesis/export family protein [Polyangiaceae bacterium]|nr:polysaccharide biosynthesis/export family protein [Polyangiaceae bacterium]
MQERLLPGLRASAVRLASLAVVASVALGCGTSGAYVWYRDLPDAKTAAAPAEYRIGVGDTLNVRVYEQPSLTSDVKIRSDGRIGLPFIGEVAAAGKTPTALAQEIQARLTQFIVNPNVTVNVATSPPIVVSVMGEVAHQGVVTLEPSTGVLQALAQAGGTSDFADKGRIFVLRKHPEFRRIRFTYDALVQNLDGAANFTLQNGDVIVVE